MDAGDLARWTRFAAKGGIGKCTATQDCVAERAEDLMFLKDDEVTVLMQLPEHEGLYLGYCEGVVGRFQGIHVRFHSKLKKPIMAKRSSSMSNSSFSKGSSSSPSPSIVPSETYASGLRVLVSSPPPIVSAPVQSQPPAQEGTVQQQQQQQRVQAYLPSQASPEDETTIVPPHSHSSTSSASDSALDTPPHTLGFDVNMIRRESKPPIPPPNLSIPRHRALPPQNSHHRSNDDENTHDEEEEEGGGGEGEEEERIIRPFSTEVTPRPPIIRESIASEPSVYDDDGEEEQDQDRHSGGRVSVALSDGEVGIGLSLLQDFAGGSGDGEDWSDESVSESEGVGDGDGVGVGVDTGVGRGVDAGAAKSEPRTRDLKSPMESIEAAGPEGYLHPIASPTESVPPAITTTATKKTTSPTSTTSTRPPPIRPPFQTRPSSRSVSSTMSKSDQGDDWEGASDIYENYRYSRYSMTSKMSTYSQRSQSQHSLHSLHSRRGSGSTTSVMAEETPMVPPPLPRMSRESTQSQQSVYSQVSSTSKTASLVVSPRQSLNQQQPHPTTTPTMTASNVSVRKERPAALKLASATSPLLHTSFASIPSPRVHSGSSSMSLLSPSYSVSGAPSPGIAASLRNQLESGHGSGMSVGGRGVVEMRVKEEGHRSRGIVIEDDEDDGREEQEQEQQQEEEEEDASVDGGSSRADDFASESADHETVQTHAEPRNSPPPPQASIPSPLQIPQHGFLQPNSLSTLSAAGPIASNGGGNPPLSPLSPLSFPLPPQQPQLHPGRSEFLAAHRTDGGGGGGGGSNRSSLFLPHPNAPRPPSHSPSPGPMYARHQSPAPRASPQPLSLSPAPPSPNNNNISSGLSSVSVLHQAAAARFTPNGQMRRTTIYGRCDSDLMRADGPVPIVFSLEPLPAIATLTPPLPPSPLGMGIGGGPQPLNIVKRSPSPAMMNPIVPSPLSRSEFSSAPQSPSLQMLSVPSGGDGQMVGTGGVIMRPGFLPQAKGARPRSRSFSGFNSQSPEPFARSHEEGSQPLLGGQSSVVAGSSQPTAAVPPQSRPQSVSMAPAPPSSERMMTSPSLSPRSPLPPSPLSMSHNDNSLTSRRNSSKSQNSPVSPVTSPPSSYNPSPAMSSSSSRQRLTKLRKAASSTTLNIDSPPTSPLGPTPPLRIPKRNMSFAESSLPSTMLNYKPPARRNNTIAHELPSSSSPTSSSIPPPPSIPRSTMQEPSAPQGWSFVRRQGSVATISSQDSEIRVASPPPGSSGVTRSASLRKKLSLPSLRGKSILIPRSDDTVNSPVSIDQDNEMVEAENIEFELIRPSMPQASGRSSEDSAVLPREPASLQLDGRPNIASHLRADSPAVSSISGASSAPRSPIGESLKPAKTSDAESMDAHRQRELKWMSLISVVPAAQARKNKKVKKLLMEGVPSSVRYLVWAHLMDSKARGMPGLYSQLGKRGKVPAFNDIEHDAQIYYPDHPQLHTAQGTLVALLQSYLTMVPDIQYETGLTSIAGRLLILAPDEDAFWIFVSLMDTYLRPWFSVNTIQMEVDASLFSKALETNDGQVAKKLYVELGLSQTAVCRPWFASLFAQSLPIEHLNRVWDIFLYEGVVFLFRVGLALIHCCRHYLLQSNGEAPALDYLMHPPLSCLPPTSDAFINLTYSFKLKDDDVRKQRIKMEAQVKRQTQTRALSVPGLSGTKPGSAISLPKT